MVKAVGSPGMVFVVWVFGGILTLFGALTYAELSAALPDAGGEYVYLTAAYGPFFGFIYGWTQTWVAKAASIATLATGFYTYLADFFPALKVVSYTIPLPIGPGGGALEIRYGQLLGNRPDSVFGGGELPGRPGWRRGPDFRDRAETGADRRVDRRRARLSSHGNTANFHLGMPADPGGIPGFFAALVAALWAYDGWNNAGMLGSEIERPQRNLPLALISGTLMMIAVYLPTNLAYFDVLSGPEVGASERVAATMMRRVMGQPGGAIVSVAAMISIFAALNGSILSGSRVPFAMARDGLFFKSMSRVHPAFRTPAASIVLLSVWSCLILLTGKYQQLYTLVIFPSWILYGMTAASVIVLRIRRPDLNRPYRVLRTIRLLLRQDFSFWSQIALLYCAMKLLCSSPRESGIGLVLIIAGLPFYFFWKKQRQAAEKRRGSPRALRN